MQRFNVSSGNGNDGVSHLHPDYTIESDSLDNAFADALADYGYGLDPEHPERVIEPDDTDWDDDSVSAVWYEIDGAPALNGGAALIVDVFPADND